MGSSPLHRRAARILAVLLLLPALLGLSVDLELGHEHDVLMASNATGDGALCRVDHSRGAEASADGLAPTTLPHRHDCAACQHSKSGRATLTRASGLPSVLPGIGPAAVAEGDARATNPGHPAPRGPPAS